MVEQRNYGDEYIYDDLVRLESARPLSKKTKDFIASIKEYIAEDKHLTSYQRKVCRDIVKENGLKGTWL